MLKIEFFVVSLGVCLPGVNVCLIGERVRIVRVGMFQAFDRDGDIEAADGKAKQKQGSQADGSLQNGMPRGFPPTAAL